MQVTADGYLCCVEDWSEAIAQQLAKQENLSLTDDHWQVIYYLRSFYQQYQLVPGMRVLIKELAAKLPPAKANSIYLQSLFPAGLMKQACKIAGLHKPVRCI